MKKSIAQILLDEGYIKSYQIVDDGTQGIIHITLKYNSARTRSSPACAVSASPACAFTSAQMSCPACCAASVLPSSPPPRAL